MSNTQVGNVYQQIIADVVDSSRVDFEEGGVDEAVLEELRKGWQTKLSQLQVALFPWDPKPDQPMQNPPMVPSNYQHTGIPPGQPIYQTPMPNGPRIKTEPGMENSGFMPVPMSQPPPQNPLMTMPNATPAQQRAAQNLHASYGQRAAASIQSIQGGGGAPQQQPMSQLTPQQQSLHAQQQQQHLQMQSMQQQQQRPVSSLPPQSQPQQPQGQPQSQQSQAAAAAYRQSIAAQQAQQLQQQQQRLQNAQNTQNAQNAQNPQNNQNGQNGQAAQAPQNPQNPQGGVGSAQTDGAGDDSDETIGVAKQFDSQGNEIAMGRVEIDNLIRSKIESMGKAMEGGGLMLPLKEANKISSAKRQRKILPGSLSQTDGPGSDDDDDKLKDELDEDAINSDLDDPDDALNDDEDEDEGMGHIMLCMYDKVQRVKNKWKCVMKDGVLTVNGKEYVFHKATGEYEW
ncbi:8a401226-162e-496e-9eef-e82fda25add3 [Sclerotinia trifoliorum]|uniref:Transcription initiation factor IIA large subunit n=1 Tax=Sclerotinia trifoliorum TaxID=28548 RepID=A0A8H2VWK3_9HELO|nr:8a401226-162e-496e-9eef-e82fda25add3 [Sclerotinia trifoliorum]